MGLHDIDCTIVIKLIMLTDYSIGSVTNENSISGIIPRLNNNFIIVMTSTV